MIDAAIVGAGFAGLAAALELSGAGLSVEVFEARDRVGGRVVNLEAGGVTIEGGGQWIGPSQDRMYALAADMGVETFPTYDTGDSVAIVKGARRTFRGDLPRLSPIVYADLAQAFLRLERAARRIPVEAPWESSRAVALDSQTFETWMRRNIHTKVARDVMRLFVTAVWAAEPASFSFLHALFYIRSGRSFDSLLRTTGGAQQDRLAGGTHGLAVKMSSRLGSAISLSAPVMRIVQGDEDVLLEGRGWSQRARRVIVAVPAALAARILFDPPLPAGKDQLLQRLPMGSVVKIHAIYPSAFWRNDGLNGQAGAPELAVSFTFDNSPREGAPGVLVGFVEAQKAREFARLGDNSRRRLALSCFERYFGSQAAEPLDYHEMDWSAEQWTRGCYGAHFPPGVWTQLGTELRRPAGRIHFAGTETATVHNGYMDGAVSSGARAAAEVMAAS